MIGMLLIWISSFSWTAFAGVTGIYFLVLASARIILDEYLFRIEQLNRELIKERKIKQSYEEAFNQIQMHKV